LKRYSFSKKKRLVSNQQFRAVMAHRRRIADNGLVMFVAGNDLCRPRLGISIGRACGCAVVRNRIKRLFRESFRLIQNDIEPGFDYLFIISPKWKLLSQKRPETRIKRLSMGDVKDIMLGLIKKAVK
jgi:ribonuclease P protein component